MVYKKHLKFPHMPVSKFFLKYPYDCCLFVAYFSDDFAYGVSKKITDLSVPYPIFLHKSFCDTDVSSMNIAH